MIVSVDQRAPHSFNREDAYALLSELAYLGSVVEDGDWAARFVDRLLDLDPRRAATAALEAISDSEVAAPVEVFSAVAVSKLFQPAVVAAMLREMWLDYGVHAEPDDLATLFSDAAQYPSALMTEDEMALLQGLPDVVTVYRGQMFGDGKNSATGGSWSLIEEVADWYAAPIPNINQPHGWVLSAEVHRSALFAVFLERGEQEVAVDVRAIKILRARRGRCDSFPVHLSFPRGR